MSVHEQFAEDLALYALGALEGSEQISLEEHLEECTACRRELERLRGDAALLALTTSGPRPPARAKSRLMDAITKEPRLQPRRVRAALWGVLGWLATAAMILVAVTLWKQNSHLSSTVGQLSGMLEKQRLDYQKVQRVADVLNAPDAAPYLVLPVSVKTLPPSGKAIYSRERNGLVFVASNLGPVPSGKAYELWLVPKEGAPIPAGVFKPDVHGGAVVLNPPLPTGVEAKAFAITIEPEQGSTTPTPPIIMMGAGG